MNITLKINEMDSETAKWIKEESKRRGIKIEKLIRELIQKGIAMEGGFQHSEVYHDLDVLSGTWNTEQTEEFINATSDFQKLDEALWR